MVTLRSGKVRDLSDIVLGQNSSKESSIVTRQEPQAETREPPESFLAQLKSAFKNYCDQTSLHGYSYLFRDEDKPNYLLRFSIWTIVILASIATSMFFMVINWSEFSTSTTVTSIESITSTLTELYFPSVFVCNINQVTLSFLASLNLTENNLSDQKMIDRLFRRFIRADARDWTNLTRRNFLTSEETEDKKNNSWFTLDARLKRIGYNGIIPVLQLSSHKSNDTILSVNWKSKFEKNFFDASFTITDYGACSIIYPYLDLENPRTRDLGSKRYNGSTYYYEMKRGVKNGVKNGLQLLIDAESFDYAYHHRGSKGFMIALADQRDRAMVYQTGFYVSTGTENLVGVSVERSWIQGTSRFKPKDRDCYTDPEFLFKYLKRELGFRASLTNCLYQAVAEKVLAECSCKPFFITFPLYPNKTGQQEPPACEGIKLACMQYYMDNLGNEDMGMKTASNEKNEPLKCLQRCSFQTEKVTVTTSRYPSDNTFLRRNDVCRTVAKIDRICSEPLRRQRFLSRYSSVYPSGDVCATNDYYFNFKDICFKNNFTLNKAVVINQDFLKVLIRYAEDNLTVLKVFFKEPYHTSIIKKDKISYINFVAAVGGLMGLCMGLSFVSVAEWIYHIGKFFYNFAKR